VGDIEPASRNRIEIVGYENIQFSNAANVLRGMGLARLSVSEKTTKRAGRQWHSTRLKP